MMTLQRGLLLLVVMAVAVMADRSRADDASPATGAAVEQSPAGTNQDANSATAGTGEKWRYKQHQGLWWYWLPSNSWVYWHEGKWVPYDADSYAKFQASRTQRGYSYSGSGQSGNWGPVRYNQYGQPQYPYSQRQSGIRQLGPVPAMGGIRSLPGWGGER